MALNVLDELCEFSSQHGTVVIRSSEKDGSLAYEELMGVDCRRLAIMTAAEHGLGEAGISGSTSIYAVDKAGKEVVDPKKQKVHAFQATIPLNKRTV